MNRKTYNPDQLNKAATESFVGLIGARVVGTDDGEVTMELQIEKKHLTFHGYLHAGCIVTLADTAAGFGCLNKLPEGADSFTTLELKCNMLGTAREGKIEAVARCIHAGRSTQVWDSTIRNYASGKVIAEFRCTQMLLYPKNN